MDLKNTLEYFNIHISRTLHKCSALEVNTRVAAILSGQSRGTNKHIAVDFIYLFSFSRKITYFSKNMYPYHIFISHTRNTFNLKTEFGKQPARHYLSKHGHEYRPPSMYVTQFKRYPSRWCCSCSAHRSTGSTA